MKNFESPKSPEEREREIDGLIKGFAEKEGITFDDVLTDMIVFAPYEGNEEYSNPEYFEIVAEKIGISPEELLSYAIKKAKDYSKELEE